MRGHLGAAAVVLGGSISGLLAARVLAESFATVVVVERDRLPDAAEPRRGVPQGRHIHGLLAGGQQAFEQLLPGLTQDLAAAGVPIGDPLADLRLCLNGHRFRQAPSGLTLVSASREMLEHHLRRRVRALPNLTVTDGCDVVGLTETGGRITGVRVLPRAGHSDEQLLNTDLVVDATGRGSRAPFWVADLGFARPEEEQLRVDLAYTTRRYRLPAETLDGDLGLLLAPTPAHPRGAALARLEHGVWMLTLIGLRGDVPPANPDGFDRFAASVGSDKLQAVIRTAEPLDAPTIFRFPASRRHYERTRLPDNLWVVGDSLASFNPVYGQGMTVAALEAVALARQLSRERVPPSHVVMGELAKIVDVPWQLAGAVDHAFVSPDKPQARRDRFMAAYVDHVQAAAAHDPVVGRGFLRVSGLIDPPSELLRPRLMWRTLRQLRAAHSGSPGLPPPAQPPADLSHGTGRRHE